jgi:hypothetical protein
MSQTPEGATPKRRTKKVRSIYEVNSQLPNLPAKNLKRVTSYVPPNAYNVLEDWAKKEDRTVSNLVSRIVSEAVDAYLAKKTTEVDTLRA